MTPALYRTANISFLLQTSKKSYLKDLAILSFEQSVGGSRRSSKDLAA